MASERCPDCKRKEPEFVSLDTCAECGNVSYLPAEEGARELSQARDEAVKDAAKELAVIGPEFWALVYSLIDGRLVKESPILVESNYQPLRVLEGTVLALATQDMRLDPDTPYKDDLESALRFYKSCRRSASYLSLAYDLKQRKRSFVEVPKDILDPDPYLGTSHALLKTDEAWRNWTWIGFGRNPNPRLLEGNYPSYVEAVEAESPGANLLRLTRTHGIDIRMIAGQPELQLSKIFFPTILKRIRTLAIKDRDVINRLAWLCQDLLDLDNLIGEPRLNKRLPGGSKGARRVPADIATRFSAGPNRSYLFPLIANGWFPALLAPIVTVHDINDRTYFVYSRNALQKLIITLRNFRSFNNGAQAGQIAGYDFERLVASVLESLGYQCRLDGYLATRIYPTKTSDHEADILCWDEDTLYIIEAKAKIDPPGAWTRTNIEDRRSTLQEWLDDLRETRKTWANHIASSKPRAYQQFGPEEEAHGRWISLPDDFYALDVDYQFISARFEPRLPGDSEHVLTLIPSKAEQIARDLFPLERLSGLWTETATIQEARTRAAIND